MGQNMYNVKFDFAEHWCVDYGIISEDRLRVACGGNPYGYTYSLEWVDEKTAENIRKINIYFHFIQNLIGFIFQSSCQK